MSSNYPLTVYYDASCPLCRAELHALKSTDYEGRLELRDCSTPDFADTSAESDGISRDAMMKAMHVRDARGHWYRGVDAFVMVYRAAGIERMVRLWAHPRLKPWWDRIYPWIARHRQIMSYLQLHRLFGWIVRRAALSAAKRDRFFRPPTDIHCERKGVKS